MKSILSLLPDVLMCAGGAAVSCGIAMINLAAGVIAAGGFLLAAGVLAARTVGK
jgi:hypothetical protein